MTTFTNMYRKGGMLMALALSLSLAGCNDFLEEQVPQGTLTQEEVKDPKQIDNLVVSAYAGLLRT